MTNKEWLDYLAHNAPDELAAWFDAEHTESPTSATMQHIGQVIEDTVKRGVYGDTEPENADSREKLEAEASELVADYAASGEVCDPMYNGIIELLDRQAAITEEQTRCKWVTASADEIAAWRSKAEKLKEQVYELTAERDKLKELNGYHAAQYELASEDCDRLQADADRLTVERDNAREESVELYSDLVKASDEREHYREKCSKMATIIHDALMVMDEGMA